MNENTLKTENLTTAIFDAVYVTMTPAKKKGVLNIINRSINNNEDNTHIANEICDYLEIERRGNRRSIRNLLNNN